MKEIIWSTINQLKRFPSNLVDVVRHPRKFNGKIPIADRNPSAGIVFLSIACVISSLLLNLYSFSSPVEACILTALTSVLLFTTTLLCGMFLIIAWGVTGRTASTRKMFQLYTFHSGAWNLLITAIYASAIGFVLRFTDISPYRVIAAFFDVMEYPQLAVKLPSVVSLAMAWVVFWNMIFVLVWALPAWLAYKDLNSAGVARSIFALVIFCFLSIVVQLGFSFAWGQLYGAAKLT